MVAVVSCFLCCVRYMFSSMWFRDLSVIGGSFFRRSLFVARCSLFGDCRALFVVVCCLLVVACLLVYVVCWLLVGCLLFGEWCV